MREICVEVAERMLERRARRAAPRRCRRDRPLAPRAARRPAPGWRWPPTGSPGARSSARSTARPRGGSSSRRSTATCCSTTGPSTWTPALKKGFAEKYGVEVNEVNFDNLEAMVIKLRSGASYDLIWPSTEYVYRLNKEGLLARFDRGLLRNSDNISSFYDSPWWDPNNELGDPVHLLHDRDRLARGRGLGDDRAPGTTSSTPTARGGCSSSTTSRRRSARRT